MITLDLVETNTQRICAIPRLAVQETAAEAGNLGEGTVAKRSDLHPLAPLLRELAERTGPALPNALTGISKGVEQADG